MTIGLALAEVDGHRAYVLYDSERRTVAPTALSGSVGDLVARFFDAGKEQLEDTRTGEWRDESAVSFLPPVDAAAKVLCVAQNFAAHAREAGGDASPPTPVIFLKPTSAFVGHLAPTSIPHASSFFDYEAELVAVVGSRVVDATIDEAQRAIAAYTIGNDGTARDLAPISIGGREIVDWFSAKSLDAGSTLGPALFAASDAPALEDVRIECVLNGEVVQDDRASSMTLSPAELISHLSRLMVLNPGDMVMTGTPAGVGKARGRALQDADELRISVAPFGTLATRMASSGPAER